MTPVNVLLTCDIHTHVTGPESVRQDLIEARRLLKELGLHCTFFFPARAAQQLSDQVAALQEEGHEIGCHGLTHVPSENYGILPSATQHEFLQQATDQLTMLLGQRPVSFRAPVFKLSRGTIAALEALGYEADLTVTAQRLGVFGSDVYDLRPLVAPRRPYHPALQNPFRKGKARIWEIPVSAWLLPFLSNTERLCGLAFMRWFFRALYLEARVTGKPIVFMFHAEDLNGSRLQEPWRLAWKDFLPTRTDGLQFRHALLEHDWPRVQRDLMALLEFMVGFQDVRVLTVKEYLPILEGAVSGQPSPRQEAIVAAPAAVAVAPEAPPGEGLTGKDILCFSSIDWDFIWQGHQEIMTALAKQGNRVLFVENTGVRAPTLKDWPRLQRRLWNWLRATKGFRQERDNLFVYSPLLVPFPYARPARWINQLLLLRALRRWMRTIGFRHVIIWTFLPTPLVLDLIRELDAELTIFYWIDKLSESSKAAKPLERFERQLLTEADLVFVTSRKLSEMASQFSDRVHVFPFGVNWGEFEQARRTPRAPKELRDIRRPIIGYVGGIRKEIDQQLLYEVAARIPEASFVMLGPFQVSLTRRIPPNLLFLGSRKHEELPDYIGQFDVGIIPYAINEYTAYIYPAKLNEYLAMGIPVVSTALPEILRMNAEDHDPVAVARDAEGFSRAIRSVLANGSDQERRKRLAVAKRNAWDKRIDQMSSLIHQVLLEPPDRTVGSWQASLLHLYRRARYRIVKIVMVVGLVYLIGFHSPVIWWIAEPLRLAEPARPADAIVVFAGGVGESGKAGEGYQERVKHAVDLYHAGFSPVIIFSSGYTFIFQEAEMMKALAVTHGVPEEAIILDTDAANTFQNTEFVERILRERGWRSILLVSSPYHMRRAIWTFHKIAPQVQVIPTPVPSSQFYAHESRVSLEQIQGILHEYIGLLSYWLKGWI